MRAHANLTRSTTDPEVAGWRNINVGTALCGTITDGLSSRPADQLRTWRQVTPTKGPGTMREWIGSRDDGKILVRPRYIVEGSLRASPYMVGVSTTVVRILALSRLRRSEA